MGAASTARCQRNTAACAACGSVRCTSTGHSRSRTRPAEAPRCASGYVLKSGADTDIVDACRAAMRGDSFLYPSAVTTLVRDYVERGGRGEEQFDVLTPRELEVLKLIAEAHTSKEIAELLFISIKTVERHRQNILDKLGLRARVELTRYAIRRGLIQP